MCVIQYTSRSLPSSWASGADGRLAPHRLRRAALALLPRLRRGVRRTHARADVWERVRGVPRRRPALDTADDPMAVEMIGGPRLEAGLLAASSGQSERRYGFPRWNAPDMFSLVNQSWRPVTSRWAPWSHG